MKKLVIKSKCEDRAEIRIPKGLKKDATKIARQYGMTFSEIVRHALSEFVYKRK